MTTLAPPCPARARPHVAPAVAGPHLRTFTVDEYHRLVEVGILTEGARTELIDGLILNMAPFTPRHIAVVDRFAKAFFRIAGDDARVSIQNSLRLNDGTEPEPDVMILADGTPEDRLPIASDVILVVEIAVTTEAFDRNVKLVRYAEAGIPEAWLVLPEKRTVETFRRPGPSGYTETAFYTEADTVEMLGASLDVAGLFPPA